MTADDDRRMKLAALQEVTDELIDNLYERDRLMFDLAKLGVPLRTISDHTNMSAAQISRKRHMGDDD